MKRYPLVLSSLKASPKICDLVNDIVVLYTMSSCLQNESYITLRDLKGCKLSGSVFNILFNLNKFMAFETRDPFLIRQVGELLFHMATALWSTMIKWQAIFCFYRWWQFPPYDLQERENPTLTEWDRFAHREYIRLSMEEDVEDASNGSAEVWDESLEAPFWVNWVSSNCFSRQWFLFETTNWNLIQIIMTSGKRLLLLSFCA